MIVNGNALALPIASGTVQTVVTSPPYWGLRDYGQDGQLGLETTPEEYVANMVQVFREVWRVLRDDGIIWLNLGDTYAGGGRGGNTDAITGRAKNASQCSHFVPSNLKAKDLIGIPWRVAFALQADGWYLRSDIIWSKPNPMPESVTDRPTKAHEYLFLMSKQRHYFYDAEAIKEPVSENTHLRISQDLANQIGSERANGGTRKDRPMKAVISSPKMAPAGSGIKNNDSFNNACALPVLMRNKRTVWEIVTQGVSYAHFATFPEALVEPCVLAGTSERGCCPKCGKGWTRVTENESADHTAETGSKYPKGSQANRLALLRQAARKNGGEYANENKTLGWQPGCTCDAGEPVPCLVLDPFAGSGTVERVAIRHRRRFIGTELKYAYISEIATLRTANVQIQML